MEQHHISVEKSARFVTIGKPTEQIENVWICLHGYGQLAAWFAKRFETHASKKRLFIFPEGQHRFYLEGTSGRVGASWMTKEDRLTDIEDQFVFLEKLQKHFVTKLPENVQWNVLGFSQGVATALRWLDKSQLPVENLVCWAGSFPPDIDYKLHKTRFDTMRMQACFGSRDHFISEENAHKLLAQMAEQQIEVQPHFYEGGHKIYPKLLAELIESCESKS